MLLLLKHDRHTSKPIVRVRTVIVHPVYYDRVFKRRSIVFEICLFIYDICYNAYRLDSGYGQIRRQHEVLFPPVPEERSENRTPVSKHVFGSASVDFFRKPTRTMIRAEHNVSVANT
jgi:hypothetical protein